VNAKLTRRPHPLALALLACAHLAFMGQARALTFDEALDLAIGYDKKYAAAIFEARSSEYLPTIARAGLMPKLSISGFQANNNLTQTGSDVFGNVTTTPQNYTAKSLTGQLTQPLINLAAIAAYLQSKKQEKAAQQKLMVDLNELKTKVIEAYCALAAAKEVHLDTAKELGTLIDQEQIVSAKQKMGAASHTDLEEVIYAKLQTQATLDDANNALMQAKIDLETLTGQTIAPNESLALPAIYLSPTKKLDELLSIAKESNPKILYQQGAHESAQYEQKKNQAAYAPTVDIVGYQGYQNSNTLSTVGQKSAQGYLGLQLNIPISTGGETYGKERQAAFYAESQRLLIESETNEVQAQVKKLYSQAHIATEKFATLKAQTASAQQLYLSFVKQRELGLKSTYDLLIATRRKYQSERDLAKTKYERIGALKKLEVTVGDESLMGGPF